MAEHTLKLSRDNYVWYKIPDGKFSTYLITFQQDFVYETGDTVKIGEYAGFTVDAPTKPYYFRLENAGGSACTRYATAHDMLLTDVTGPTPHLDTSPIYERKGQYNTLYYKNTSLMAFFLHGVGTNGSTWYCIPPVCLFEDADGKLFTWDQGKDYGENSYAAGTMSLYGNDNLSPMYISGNYNPSTSGSSITNVWAPCVPGPGEVDELLIKSSEYTWKNLTAYRQDYFNFITLVGDKKPFTPRLLTDFQNSDVGKSIKIFTPNDDPYGDPDDPKEGGGTGGRGQWGESVGDDPEPTLSLSSTGMVTPYAPTLAQLKSFSQFLWSDAFSVDTFKKMFADPFQAIITCHALPFAVTAGAAANVTFGNISSDVSMDTLASQYYTIDAGTLNIQEYWGSFFDYSPYTSYMIYLPYVGYKEIKPEDFTTGSISIKYIVDAITGAFTVRLLSSKVNNSAMYQYTGDMAYSIPLSKSDYSSIISNIVSSAAAIGGGIAALAATGSAAALGSAAVSTVGKVTSSKVQVQRSGSVGGAAGWYASQTPYIIRTRPNPVLASNQNYFVGRPSYQTATLSALSGYTKVKDIRLSGITGTDSEKAEIESLLKEGVIL